MRQKKKKNEEEEKKIGDCYPPRRFWHTLPPGVLSHLGVVTFHSRGGPCQLIQLTGHERTQDQTFEGQQKETWWLQYNCPRGRNSSTSSVVPYLWVLQNSPYLLTLTRLDIYVFTTNFYHFLIIRLMNFWLQQYILMLTSTDALSTMCTIFFILFYFALESFK